MTTKSKEGQILYFKDHSVIPEDLLVLNKIDRGSLVADIADIGKLRANLYKLNPRSIRYPQKIKLSGKGQDISAFLSEGEQFALTLSMTLTEEEYNRLNTAESKPMVKKRPFLGALARINGIPIAFQISHQGAAEIIREKLIEMELSEEKPKADCSVVELHTEFPDGRTNSGNLVYLPSNSSPETLEVVLLKGSENIIYRPRFNRFSAQNNDHLQEEPEIDTLTIDTKPIAGFTIKLLG